MIHTFRQSEELVKLEQDAFDSLRKGTKHKDRTYEDGIIRTLFWLRYEKEPYPIEND
jgi:hypothetical protein